MTSPVGFAAKAPVMGVSLLLSMLLWIVIQINQPPGFQYQEVNISAVNFEKYESRYLFPKGLGSVLVRIDGPQDQLTDDSSAQKALRESKVYVYVDLNDAHPGTDRYPLNIVYRHDSQFTFTLEKPTLEVHIDQSLIRHLPVTVDTTGQIPSFLNIVYDGATADPSSVVIQGPASAVSRVKSIRALLDLSAVTATPSSYPEVILEPLDENDNPVPDEDLTVSPQAAKIVPSVAPAPQSETVLVEPIMNGHPAMGFSVTDFSVEPNQVAIQGSPDILAKLRKVSTKGISLDGLRASTTFDVPLELPPGVKTYSAKTIRVRVVIEPHSGTSAPQSVSGP
jgi:YbbR domain-containing protein